MRKPRPSPLPVGTAAAILMTCALLVAGCLGVLAQDQQAARVAEAATPALPMPLVASRPHWFLRQQPGWVGAHRTTYGGSAEGEALTIVRVARFRDVAAAYDGFARLTPEYAHRLWGRRMMAAPAPVRYSFTFPGDDVRTMEYRPRPAPDEPDLGLIVQLIALRTGETVIVIESIGVPREELPSVAAALVRAARE